MDFHDSYTFVPVSKTFPLFFRIAPRGDSDFAQLQSWRVKVLPNWIRRLVWILEGAWSVNYRQCPLSRIGFNFPGSNLTICHAPSLCDARKSFLHGVIRRQEFPALAITSGEVHRLPYRGASYQDFRHEWIKRDVMKRGLHFSHQFLLLPIFHSLAMLSEVRGRLLMFQKGRHPRLPNS